MDCAEEFTILTYNISSHNRGFAVPITLAAKCWRVLTEVAKQNADFVALQEVYADAEAVLVPGLEALGYISVESRPTPPAETFLFVHSESIRGEVQDVDLSLVGLQPAQVARVTLRCGKDVVVAAHHLIANISNKTFEDKRVKQVKELLRELTRQGIGRLPIVIAADTNMHEWEDAKMEARPPQGLGLADAFKQCSVLHDCSDKEFTWDPLVNRFLPVRRVRRERFDRIYVVEGTLKAFEMELIGCKEVHGQPGAYLSDHFGVWTRIRLLKQQGL